MASNFIRPNENDILLGRGGHSYLHSGNEQLREIARSRVDDYRRATKKQKAVISREILRQVKDLDPPGRFLRKVSTIGTAFVEVTKREAREKVCQTLRDAVSEAFRDAAASATANNEGAGAASVEGDVNADDEDDASKLPPLLTAIQERRALENPRHHECFDYESFPAEVLPLEMENAFSSVGFSVSDPNYSPSKNTPSAANVPTTVTPTNHTSETSSSLVTFTPTNQPEDTSPALEYDAYNYLSRAGIEDDFDLFDGELLRTAKHDAVFASVELLE